VATTLRPRAQRAVAGRSAGDRAADRVGFWRRNALGLVGAGMFLVLVVALALTGHHAYNSDQIAHGERTVSFGRYLTQGHFWEAVFENWESEFLQMAAYILLTVYLIQRGSAESKDPDVHEAVDDDPRHADLRKPVPAPVRRGGVWLWLYENSLLLAFAVLFLGSLLGHALGGLAEHNAELREHHEAAVTFWGYVSSSQFWYESFQNWQSEFLAVFAIVVLSIFLRQRGSPESKPVAAPHDATGST
jgi:hypothetical protein